MKELGLPKQHMRERVILKYPSHLCIDPTDWSRIVQSHQFTASWDRLGMTDQDLRALEIVIMFASPGAVMPHTGGLRKLRFAREGRGKSGGIRVCYVAFPEHGVIYLIQAYGKGDKSNLTKSESMEIAKGIKRIQIALDRETRAAGKA
jgi:hypothetical protein